MARSGFHKRRRSLGSRFAKKKLLWVNSVQTVAEVAGTTTHLFLIGAGLWQINPSVGDLEHAKCLRLQLLIRSSSLATPETRLFNLFVDDVSQTTGLNPMAVATYAQVEPFHQGLLYNPANVAAAGPVPLFNGYPDNVRSIRVNRRLRSDQEVFMDIEPATAAADQLSLTVFCRALIQLD